jgi:hypothetical protein
VLPVQALGGITFAQYWPGAGDEQLVAHALLTVGFDAGEPGQIGEIVAFLDPALFGPFGLPGSVGRGG